MIRTLLILILALSPVALVAKDTPLISVELAETEVIVGQPLIVQVKVLVSTFTPAPPEFPSLEVPGLIVRLPQRASRPITETVNGETWSGVQRSYRVYPLRAGGFEIPAQTVSVTYATPGGIEPVTVELDTDPIRFQAIVPDAAADLSPLIIANGFTLSQTLDVPDAFDVGDALVRTVTAEISGTTPILIPQLIPDTNQNQLRAYPKDPSVSEHQDRGLLSGTRTETVTYLAVEPDNITLPEITAKWFNLQSGAVETAMLSGADLTITGTAAPEAEQRAPVILLIFGGLGLLILGTAGFALQRVLRSAVRRARVYWQNSEPYDARQVHAAIKQRDLGRTFDALTKWQLHVPNTSIASLDDAIARIGACSYSARPDTARAVWPELSTEFTNLRRQSRRLHHANSADLTLPDLNASARRH